MSDHANQMRAQRRKGPVEPCPTCGALRPTPAAPPAQGEGCDHIGVTLISTTRGIECGCCHQIIGAEPAVPESGLREAGEIAKQVMTEHIDFCIRKGHTNFSDDLIELITKAIETDRSARL